MKKIGIIAVYKEDVHGPFSRLYHDYIHAIESYDDMVVHLIPCNTRHIDHFISEMDGFILPGGNDVDPCVYGHDNIASRDTFSKNDVRVLGFIKKIVESKKPLLGVCRGMQLLNIHFRGTLTQNIDEHELHDQGSKSREYIHEVEIGSGTRLRSIFDTQRLQVNSVHHQAIDILGEGLVPTAKSIDGYIEAIEHMQHKQILGVQWHPELLESHHHIFQKFLEDC